MTANEFNQQFLIAMEQEALKEEGDLIVHYSQDGQPEAVSIRFPEGSFSSVAYLDSLYDLNQWDKMNIETLVSETMKSVRQMKPLEFTKDIISKNNAPTHLKAAIVNYEANKAYLENVPHERYFDMAIVMDWDFGDGHLIHIHDSTLPQLRMTAEQALTMAKENSFRELEPLKSMYDDAYNFTQRDKEIVKSTFYILGTKDIVNGGIAIADTKNLSRIREQLGEDFYALPTSINETIIIPKSKITDVNDLDSMMASVVRMHEGTGEHLSDHVFIYQNNHLEIKPETHQNLLGGHPNELTEKTRHDRSIQTLPENAPAYGQRNRTTNNIGSHPKDDNGPEERENKLKELTDQLEAGIKEVFESGKYREYLSIMNKFHSYSANNTLLILMQNPAASYVASFKVWKDMERHVKKDERGIRILAPEVHKYVQYVDRVNPETGKTMRDGNGKPLKERQEETYLKFHATSIFDISQTEGKPLPELTEELKGAIPDYKILMDSIREVVPVPIRFEEWEKSKKGHYDLDKKEIVIKSGMSELQTIKTAIHEMAHSILHKDKGHIKDSATMEVEAESVAYVVSQHLGLDTSDYSFGYLAGWSSGKELPELKSSLQTIQKAAHEVIEQLDKAILKNTNNIDISQTVADEPLKISSIADTIRHRR